MGAYDADNDQTFSACLEQHLHRDFPDRQVEVINAGIVGYGLAEESRMLEKRVAPLRTDLTIVRPASTTSWSTVGSSTASPPIPCASPCWNCPSG